MLRLSVRLTPFHNWLADQLLGQVVNLQGRYTEALEHLGTARGKNPRFFGSCGGTLQPTDSSDLPDFHGLAFNISLPMSLSKWIADVRREMSGGSFFVLNGGCIAYL